MRSAAIDTRGVIRMVVAFCHACQGDGRGLPRDRGGVRRVGGSYPAGRTLPEDAPELAVVNDDDTIVEVAAVMARLRCPLAAVMDGDTLVGVITASRLLQLALSPK